MNFATLATPRTQNDARPNWVARHPMLSLIAIMYAFTWTILIPQALASQGLLPFQIPTPISLLTGWGPAIAALIVVYAMDGRAGIKNLLRRFRILRANIVWYLVALFGTAFVILGGIAIYALLGNSLPTLAVFNYPLPTIALGFFAAIALGFLFNTEEFAWRGVMLPYLQKNHSALIAALLIGIPETLLHLPYFFNKDAVFYQQVGILWFTAFTFAEVILVAWLFNSTRGSLFIVTLFHAAQNAWASLLAVPQAQPFYYSVILLMLAALAVLVVFGAENLSRQVRNQL